MSDFTPPNGMPKDINNRLCGVKGLDPKDPNDMAFKLVTIYCVFCCVEKTHLFFLFFVNSAAQPPPPPTFSLNPLSCPPPLTPTSAICKVAGLYQCLSHHRAQEAAAEELVIAKNDRKNNPNNKNMATALKTPIAGPPSKGHHA